MKEFLKTVYKRNDIFLHELNNEFIRDFDFFLKTNKKLQNNSANKHHKNLKKIIHMAVSNEWLDKNPFAGFRLKNEKTKVVFLLKEEIEKIIKKEFETERLRKVADVFIFCCYTGLAFIDSKKLTPIDLMTDNEGQLWIVKNRNKTDNTCNIPVIDAARKIIEKPRKTLIFKEIQFFFFPEKLINIA